MKVKSRYVGVIVPLAEEFDYVREVLPMDGGEVIDGEQYHRFAIPEAAVTGIVRVLSDMGQAHAAFTADRMISRLGVSLVVLMGTAAGLDREIQLGDVVVADQIQEYLRGAKVTSGRGDGSFAFERTIQTWRTNMRLLDHVRNFGWLPDSERAVTGWQEAAAARWPGQRQGELPHPKVHVGPLATGDLVVAADAFADWIRAGNRKLLALEMEAGGAAFAAYQNDSADLLVVRGVSDYADKHKSTLDAGDGGAGIKNAWRRYAVRNAIEYLVVLLSSSGFPWRIKQVAKLATTTLTKAIMLRQHTVIVSIPDLGHHDDGNHSEEPHHPGDPGDHDHDEPHHDGNHGDHETDYSAADGMGADDAAGLFSGLGDDLSELDSGEEPSS